MSQDIPLLSTVYQRVETNTNVNEQEEISLEVKSISEESCKDDSGIKSESSSVEKEILTISNSRKRLIHNACACFGAFSSLCCLIYFVIVASVMIRVGTDLQQCFESNANVFKDKHIGDRSINQINLNVVSGLVFVEYEDRPDIYIRVWDNARSLSYVDADTFDSGITVINSTVHIHSIAPSFNLKSCIHAKVEILIPNTYHHTLSINGNVKLGIVKIKGNENKLVGIDINVELGKIDVKGVILSNSLSLISEVGYIKVEDVEARQNAKLQSHTGYIRTHDVKAKNFASSTEFGYSKHKNLNAEVANLDTRFGYQVVDKVSPLNNREVNINLNTEYGKSRVVVDTQNVNFTMGTASGRMKIQYEDAAWACNLDKSTHKLMNGKCIVLNNNDKNLVKLAINTKYGNSKMVLDHVEDDEY
jgi:hypothetical protein